MKKTKEELRLGLLKSRVFPPLTQAEKKELKDWETFEKKIETIMGNETEIEVNELRIGNIVSHSDYTTEYFEVLSIELLNGDYIVNTNGGKNGTWTNPIEMINKVPITEDFLLLMGFEYNQYNRLWEIDGVSFYYDLSYFYYTEHSDYHPDDSSALLTVKYVHQLQNLYFDLMGKELIK